MTPLPRESDPTCAHCGAIADRDELAADLPGLCAACTDLFRNTAAMLAEDGPGSTTIVLRGIENVAGVTEETSGGLSAEHLAGLSLIWKEFRLIGFRVRIER